VKFPGSFLTLFFVLSATVDGAKSREIWDKIYIAAGDLSKIPDEAPHMTPTLWIALAFAAVLVVFLMVVALIPDDPRHYNRDNILRFFMSLCAGFAGGFFTGDALFRYNQSISGGGKLFVSGTAGCALFFTIWFTTRKRPPAQPPPPPPPPPPDVFKLSFGDGWTFERVVRTIVKAAKATLKFDGFFADQLAIKLPATDIAAPSARDAIDQLRYRSNDLPDYKVDVVKGVFHVRV
jgi:hypothetical protein